MASNGLTAYRLVQESRGELAQNTIYAMAKKPAQRVDLDTVAKIIKTLGRLQQREVTLTDLIEIVEERSPEDTSWQTADLSRLAEEEPYDWGGVDPLTLGKAVHVTASGEITAEQ